MTVSASPKIPDRADVARVFGKVLRKYRRAADVTRADLAEQLGVKQAAVSSWEAGRELPPLPKIIALRARLGPAFIDALERELGLGGRSKSMRERG